MLSNTYINLVALVHQDVDHGKCRTAVLSRQLVSKPDVLGTLRGLAVVAKFAVVEKENEAVDGLGNVVEKEVWIHAKHFAYSNVANTHLAQDDRKTGGFTFDVAESLPGRFVKSSCRHIG